MDASNDKVTIIIRSAGERTEQLCRELILAQGIPPTDVIIVRESPFSAAMRTSFKIGIERGRPWTLCNDADVLLRPGAIEHIVRLAEEQEENVCEIQGYILDKLFGGPRHGGIHLYRTSLLPKVLASIPAEGVDVRPEYHTLKAMQSQGHPFVIAPYLVGLHDFEQYYADIFRKCLVHAHKHHYLLEMFLTFWREQAPVDKDYYVALQGLGQGIAHCGEVLIDIEQEVYREGFARLGIEEKGAIPIDEYPPAAIEALIAGWQQPEPYRRFYPTEMGLAALPGVEALPLRKKLAQRLKEWGVLRTALYGLGWTLSRIGNVLQAKASS